MEEQTVTPPNCETLNYSVLSLVAVKKPAEGTSSPNFATGMHIGEDGRIYDVFLRCSHQDGDFTFDCIVEGNFKYHDSITEGTARNAWINGCMILYGIIRAIYMTTAAQCVHRTPVLPSVMMVDVVNRQIEELKRAAETAAAQASSPSAQTD